MSASREQRELKAKGSEVGMSMACLKNRGLE